MYDFIMTHYVTLRSGLNRGIYRVNWVMGKESWYVSILVLFSILLIAPAAGMQSAFADGNESPDECLSTNADVTNLDADDHESLLGSHFST